MRFLGVVRERVRERRENIKNRRKRDNKNNKERILVLAMMVDPVLATFTLYCWYNTPLEVHLFFIKK